MNPSSALEIRVRLTQQDSIALTYGDFSSLGGCGDGNAQKKPHPCKNRKSGLPSFNREDGGLRSIVETLRARNGSALAFDLATAILLEYLLERFFEAGEGAKAV